MNIGEAARKSGVSAKMIRYYEQTALIPPVGRTAAGYRDYSDNDVHILSFVRRARDMGFSVGDISELLGLWTDTSRKSADVKKLALRHLDILRGKIQELEAMSRSLEHLAGACKGDSRPDCPILDDLESSRSDDRANSGKKSKGAVEFGAIHRGK
ncbi:Cu(I)-responsive transcriptional regulator [Thalassovita aquimarina]|uniref:Cu(I)-responsive transcriptional regulator n=1 Tax=Thalassovita aquimarina TaxID=2785917 RepID=A0ABS5HWS7_9RHOB|nr:Cu(I)-responsive transcriptional regulator [Thalassovita aquimarina]MBR9653423.1 Cu(I)-responsive transcriptional regulator [Thalassovita aquimarina]